MQKRIEKTMQIQMRFGCVLGGCSEGRAMRSQLSPPPYYTIKKKHLQTQTHMHHEPKAPTHADARDSAVADIQVLYDTALLYKDIL